MRKNLLIIGLAGVLGMSIGLSSCAPDYETSFNTLTLAVPDESQAPIIFPLNGGQQEIQVETNVPYDNWTAKSNAEWCKLDKQENKVVISADKNEIYKQRIAQITIAYGHQSYAINVTQFGLAPVILVGESAQQDGYIKVVDPKVTSVIIPIKTNLDLNTITVPDTCDWVRLKEPEQQKSQRAENAIDKSLEFDLDQNTDTVVRYCTVVLQSSQNYSCAATFIIKQQKRGYIVEADESVKNFNLESSGGTITVPFKVNGPENTAYKCTIEESAKSWIKLAPATRGMRDKSESFIIEPNVVETERVGHITFSSIDPSENSTFTVTVTQEKFIPVPPFNVVHATATPGDGFITLNWQMPEKVNFTKMKIMYNDPVRRQEITKEINNNSTTSHVIKGTYECAGTYTFTITTYGPTGMATEENVIVEGTSKICPKLSRIPLTENMISANATQPGDGGGIPALIDDKAATYYHSAWQNLAPNNAAHHVQINLNEAIDGIRIEYNARNDGGSRLKNEGDVKRAGIWGSDTGADNSSWLSLGTVDYNLPTTAGGLGTPIDNTLFSKPYKYIRFTPQARRALDPLVPTVAASAWWNMGDILVYKVNNQDESWARKELGLPPAN